MKHFSRAFVTPFVGLVALLLSCIAVAAPRTNLSINVLPCGANPSAAVSFATSADARTLSRGGDRPLAGAVTFTRRVVHFEGAIPPGHYFVNVRSGSCAAQVAVTILGAEHRTFLAHLGKDYGGPLDLWQNSLAGTLPLPGVPAIVLMSPNDDVQLATGVVDGGRYYFEYLKPMKYNLRVLLSQDGTKWAELHVDLRDPRPKNAIRNLSIEDLRRHLDR